MGQIFFELSNFPSHPSSIKKTVCVWKSKIKKVFDQFFCLSIRWGFKNLQKQEGLLKELWRLIELFVNRFSPWIIYCWHYSMVNILLKMNYCMQQQNVPKRQIPTHFPELSIFFYIFLTTNVTWISKMLQNYSIFEFRYYFWKFLILALENKTRKIVFKISKND